MFKIRYGSKVLMVTTVYGHWEDGHSDRCHWDQQKSFSADNASP